MFCRIKVRAWDLHNKKMISAEEIGGDELSLHPNEGGFFIPHSEDKSQTLFLEHLYPLQSTGRYDKKWQEVYEGDLLYYSTSNQHHVVIWRNLVAGFKTVCLENKELYGFDPSEGVVIGHRFDNRSWPADVVDAIAGHFEYERKM